MQIHNAVITGSFSYNGADLSNVTSSNAYSASLSSRTTDLETTSSVLVGASASFSSILTSVSSSQQQISASLLNVIAVYATTGSNSFRANQSITGSLTVTGQIVAQSLNVQQVTSSIVFSSGSNTFGCDLNSRQTFTGSVIMTGSLTVNTTGTELQVNNNGVVIGNLLTDNHSITGSLRITGSNVIIAGALCGTNSTFTSFTQASNFISDGNQFFSFTLKGRASDNFGAIGFYNNSGATRVGYIQSGTICGGQINITGDGGGSITLDNRGINATGAATFSNIVNVGYDNNNRSVLKLTSNAANRMAAVSFYGNNIESGYIGYEGGSEIISGGQQGDLVIRNVLAGKDIILDTNGGNVGIGTTSPSQKLHIASSSNPYVRIDDTGVNSEGGVIMQPTGYNAKGGLTLNFSNGEFKLFTGETGNGYFQTLYTNGVERMRITSGGQVNVNSTQTTYPFYVQAALGNWTAVFDNTTSGASGILMRSTGGSQGFYYGAYDGGAYKFYVSGGGGIHSTSTSITIISSDIKLKTDIRDYDKGLAEVLAMKPRIYKRKDNLEIDEVGFIAQEMDIAFTGSMIESYKDEKGESIYTYQLEWYPLLVKAIQELKAEIETLKNK